MMKPVTKSLIKPVYTCTLLLALLSADAKADSYNVTTFAVPGASVTAIEGINSLGEAVGYYAPGDGGPLQGFTYQHGQITTFGLPAPGLIEPSGINDVGQIVGDIGPAAFLDTGGSFEYFSVPNTTNTFANGINNSGTVVGTAFNSSISSQLFTYSQGVIKVINTPGFEFNGKVGITNSGEIYGSACPAPQVLCPGQAFVYSNGILSLLNLPGATASTILEIDDQGTIRGTYTSASGIYAYQVSNGVITTLNLPSFYDVSILAANSSGVFGGAYLTTLDTGGCCVYDSFLATPVPTPEPAPAISYGLGLALLSAVALRRQLNAKCSRFGKACQV